MKADFEMSAKKCLRLALCRHS